MDVRVRTEPRGERCPVCHDEDMSDKPIIRCGACSTVTHAECRSAHGSCPTLGCSSSAHPKNDESKKGAGSGGLQLKWTEGPPGCFSAPAPIIELTEAEKLQAAEVRDRVASEFTLRRQLPLLGAILLVPAIVVFLAWLLVQIVRLFLTGHYIPGAVGLIFFIAWQLFGFVRRKLSKRQGTRE